MKKIFPILIFAVLAFILIMMNGMVGQDKSMKSQKLQVVTSVYPLYYFATQIGGDKVDVTNIIPAGAEPHEYEPTARDIASIEKSDLLILNGAKLEPWADRVKKDLQGTPVLIITAGEGLTDLALKENNTQITDPHIWLSPPLAKKEIEHITQGLIHADIQNTEYYQNNADSLIQKMDALHNEFVSGLAQCNQKNIVTSHAAFGYLARTYGLRQTPIATISTQEPSIKQLAEIVDFMKQNNINYIFVERLVSPKLAETLSTEVGAQTLILDPIEGLSNQDMKAGKNYFTMMQDNLTNLRTALECL